MIVTNENISQVKSDAGIVFNIPKLEESTVDDFYCADTIGRERFVLNFGGYPRNDISIINEQTSIQAAQALLNQMVHLDGTLSQMDDIQLSLVHRSKYCQTYSEGAAYVESQLQRIRNESDLKDLQKSTVEGTIKFNEKDNANE